ncbi:hypothetical protein [Crocosphaera chwakensis]|nr:hypothetical protein [Crocosphaera chwakensis]
MSKKNIPLSSFWGKQFKIVIEKHPDGYSFYLIGVVGAIVGQGDTYEEL